MYIEHLENWINFFSGVIVIALRQEPNVSLEHHDDNDGGDVSDDNDGGGSGDVVLGFNGNNIMDYDGYS